MDQLDRIEKLLAVIALAAVLSAPGGKAQEDMLVKLRQLREERTDG